VLNLRSACRRTLAVASVFEGIVACNRGVECDNLGALRYGTHWLGKNDEVGYAIEGMRC